MKIYITFWYILLWDISRVEEDDLISELQKRENVHIFVIILLHFVKTLELIEHMFSEKKISFQIIISFFIYWPL